MWESLEAESKESLEERMNSVSKTKLVLELHESPREAGRVVVRTTGRLAVGTANHVALTFVTGVVEVALAVCF